MTSYMHQVITECSKGVSHDLLRCCMYRSVHDAYPSNGRRTSRDLEAAVRRWRYSFSSRYWGNSYSDVRVMATKVGYIHEGSVDTSANFWSWSVFNERTWRVGSLFYTTVGRTWLPHGGSTSIPTGRRGVLPNRWTYTRKRGAVFFHCPRVP